MVDGTPGLGRRARPIASARVSDRWLPMIYVHDYGYNAKIPIESVSPTFSKDQSSTLEFASDEAN